FWRRQLLADARALGLGVAIGWVSFGIASLTRNTGVALGFGFVYFAILENILRVVADWPEPYLIGNAVAAWLNGSDTLDGGVVLSRGGAAAVLVAYAAGIVAIMTALFARRDVT
ncbi:MAG TPA: hypothetical protein VNA14_02480, partial [Mycobacteriales bacterium]|nr:hypothetical protein [Mycobacteriales bacterium]